MKRFYCNGKKGYCDRGNDCNIDCKDCEFANGTGGDVVDVSDTVYEKIKAMSIEEYDYCPYCGAKMDGAKNEVD